MTTQQHTTKSSEGNVLEFRPTGPPQPPQRKGSDRGIKVDDEITVEIRLKVTDVARHPDRALVIGVADDGSMVTFDANAPRAVFWNWD